MMRFSALCLFAVVSFFSYSFSAIAIETPDDFLARIYEPYSHEDLEPVPISRSDKSRIASKKFFSIIDENWALTPPGDIGYFGSDPICQCQDYQNLIVTDIRILTNDGRAARAAVTFLPFHDGDFLITTQFDLVVEDGGWFIDDIFDENQSSLREAISESNRELRKGLYR